MTLLLAIVHRPLVFWGVRYFALGLAKENHLHLVYEIGGSIFTGVKVTNLQALPTDPGPVERIQIGTLHLRYSLMAVIRHGLPALLDDVDLRDVFVVIDPARMISPERPGKDQTTGNFPLFFPTHLNLENLKRGNYLISVHADNDDQKDRAKGIFKNHQAEDATTASESAVPHA